MPHWTRAELIRREGDGREGRPDRQEGPPEDRRAGEAVPVREVPEAEPAAGVRSRAVVLPEVLADRRHAGAARLAVPEFHPRRGVVARLLPPADVPAVATLARGSTRRPC